MEKNLDELKDIEFYFSEEMKKTLFDMIAIQELLNDKSLNYREITKLEKEKERLLEIFRRDLQSYNPVQVMVVRNFLNMNNEEDVGH